MIKADSKITVEDPVFIQDKKVLIVEDGPTLTHGGMKLGAGTIAAERLKARELVDPRPYAVGSLKDTYNTYPNIGKLLPAMGYDEQQLKDLEETINHTNCDSVIIGTPIDLTRIININKPHTRVHYELDEHSGPNLEAVLENFIQKYQL